MAIAPRAFWFSELCSLSVPQCLSVNNLEILCSRSFQDARLSWLSSYFTEGFFLVTPADSFSTAQTVNVGRLQVSLLTALLCLPSLPSPVIDPDGPRRDPRRQSRGTGEGARGSPGPPWAWVCGTLQASSVVPGAQLVLQAPGHRRGCGGLVTLCQGVLAVRVESLEVKGLESRQENRKHGPCLPAALWLPKRVTGTHP